MRGLRFCLFVEGKIVSEILVFKIRDLEPKHGQKNTPVILRFECLE